MKKGLILLTVGILFVVGLAGCLSAGEELILTPTPLVSATPVPATPTPAPVTTPSLNSEADTAIIYVLNPNTYEKKAITIAIENKSLSLLEFATVITDSLEDESFTVDLKEAYYEKTVAVVDFSKEGAPGVSNPDCEAALLDCIGQSIIDNYDGCSAVVFRIDGEAYRTANLSLERDEAYLTR